MFDDEYAIYIDSLDIEKIFENSNDDEKLRPQDYSFLDPNNIYQSAKIVKTIFDCRQYTECNKPILLDLVSFKPHRILLQEIAAQFTTYTVIDEKDPNNKDVHILIIYREIVSRKSTYDIFSKNYNGMYIELKQKYMKEIYMDMESQSKELLSEIDKAQHFFRHNRCFNYEGLTCQELAIEMVVAKKYNNQARQAIRDYVKTAIREYIDSTYIKSDYKLKQRIPALPNKRSTLFIVGGPGSGKSKSSKLLKESFRKEKNISGLVEINTDSYKDLLMRIPLTPKLILSYSQLVQPEAAFVRRQALELSRKENMHVLIDQVFLSKDILDDSKEGTVEGILVSTKVEIALKRAESRGIVEGRFEDTKGILYNHKKMTFDAIISIKNLLKDSVKNIKITFNDNSVDGKDPCTFMEIDFNQKTITIKNKGLLKDFFKKQFIKVPQSDMSGDILKNFLQDPYEYNCTGLQNHVEKELTSFFSDIEKFGVKIISESIQTLTIPEVITPKLIVHSFSAQKQPLPQIISENLESSEHSSYVQTRLPNTLTQASSLRTTTRRLTFDDPITLLNELLTIDIKTMDQLSLKKHKLIIESKLNDLEFKACGVQITAIKHKLNKALKEIKIRQQEELNTMAFSQTLHI